MSSKTEPTPSRPERDHVTRDAMLPILAAKTPASPLWFCRLAWLDDLLAVPPWAPEGDLSHALHSDK